MDTYDNCYPPAYYDMECDIGLYATADFLYWYGRETNLSFAVKCKTVSSVTDPTSPNVPELIFQPKEHKHLDTEWAPGARLGLGWNTGCDGWDVYIDWTYYHNKNKTTVTVEPFSGSFPAVGEEGLYNPWLDENVVFDTAFDFINAGWDFTLNQLDFELGRKYWLSRHFTMRPFAGVRAAWTKTDFEMQSITSNFNCHDHFENRFSGVGLMGGFQPAWYLMRCFAVYANADISLLWGEFRAKKHENYTGEQELIPSLTIQLVDFHESEQNHFIGMQAILDLALGLRYETCWCENRYRFALDAGWEHHIWFDHNTRIKYLDSVVATVPQNSIHYSREYDEWTANLVLGGFVLRARFDF